ncbi:hypothetical protein SESBI_36918 [Sesbania bispinosa]|nr:hypothetical protein SESBI_36918 [Sesbania bispinosa]
MHLPRAKSQLLQSSFFTHLVVNHSPPPPLVQPPSNRNNSYIQHHCHLLPPHGVARPTHPLRTTIVSRRLSQRLSAACPTGAGRGKPDYPTEARMRVDILTPVRAGTIKVSRGRGAAISPRSRPVAMPRNKCGGSPLAT